LAQKSRSTQHHERIHVHFTKQLLEKTTELLEHNYLKRRYFSSFKGQHKLILQSACVSDHPLHGRQWISLFSDWLSAVPNKQLGQSMTADQFRAALCFRSLVPFFRKAQECRCGKELDIFGYHALSCQGPTENLTFSRHKILTLL